MYLSRVQIKNFRNFGSLDVALNANAVIVGENRVGKSNFLLALRLVLDSSLSDAARQLKLTDIWDDYDKLVEPRVEIHLDFADFDSEPELIALLTDYRLAGNHTIARISYLFRKRAEIIGTPKSEADFEFKIYGADDETRSVSPQVRRRICLALLPALRDAESELSTWRSSPLRSLLDDAIGQVPKDELEKVAKEVTNATSQITNLSPILALETSLRKKMADLAGPAQDIQARLGIAPTDPLRLFRSLHLLIDDGKRGISDASLGSANLALLTLKLAEFEWQRKENDHNFTLVCVEEPEAHLHPQLQRTVFRKLFDEIQGQPLSLLLTTHSPNLVSVAPLSSIMVLRQENGKGTKAYSLAHLALSAPEIEDLQRYLDVSRAEILFSKAVVFVEGDAELALVPVFAQTLGFNLDDLGITVCSVGGVNFSPYIRLASALSLPFCVITDWDPMDVGLPLGVGRLIKLIDVIRTATGQAVLSDAEKSTMAGDENALRKNAGALGIFSNTTTLETEIASTPGLGTLLLEVIETGEFGAKRQQRIDSWKIGQIPIDGDQLLAMIADIGKGRLAARMAARAIGLQPPEYIKASLEHILPHG